MRFVLCIIGGLVLVGLVSTGPFAVPPLAPHAVLGADPPPWEIGTVTTQDLTSSEVERALPENFASYHLDEVFQVDEEELDQPGTTSEKWFVYQNREDPGLLLAFVITAVEPDVPIHTVIRHFLEGQEDTPGFTTEERDLSSSAAIPYLLAKEVHDNYSIYALIWGARGGSWIFTVFSPTEPDRQLFVRTLVSNLKEHSSVDTRETSRAPTDDIDPEDMYAMLLEAPFRDRELPAGFASAEVTSWTTDGDGNLPDGAVGVVEVDISLPRRGGSQSIVYYVFETPSDAEHYHQTAVTLLERDQGMTAIELPDFGYPAVLLTSPGSQYVGPDAACWVQDGIVVVAGFARVPIGAPAVLADEGAYSLALAGVAHLERVVAEAG